MKYSADTSAILDGWRRYYPPDVFPALWTQLGGLIESGEFAATEEVLFELEKGDDEVFQWAKLRKTRMFVPIDDRQQQEVLFASPHGCRVHSLGAERVLLIRSGAWREPIIPPSAAAELEEEGVPRERALELAGTVKRAVMLGSDIARYMRTATIAVAAGDWLLVAPESKALVGLTLQRQPADVSEIAGVMKTLSAPYAGPIRSWLALRVHEA